MLEGLQAILEKEVVIATVSADDLARDPGKVEADYQYHVATFIPMGEIQNFADRIVKKVLNNQTPKGLVIAPYGYGKTSTMIFLWHYAEQQGLLTVPPFYCTSFLDILKATYAWARYKIDKREPTKVPELNELYRRYTTATIETMAKRYAQEQGLASVQARGILSDLLAQGRLILELTPDRLLSFVEEVVHLTISSGYKGLLILPDEFQQYLQEAKSLRRRIQELRDFIWGLATRSKPLGIVFSLPTYAESIIQEQGKDILHRFKKDGLVYRLKDIYTRDFPARLWARYAETFHLGDLAKDVIEDTTLEAVGQIAEREDLGEGPRTVIDAFKRAILHYQDRSTPYTPIDLIDDFLSSNIRFQSHTNRIRTVVRQALSSALVDTPEKGEAVKLMAAFPKGCPPEIQKRYGLYDVVNSLSKQGHGELMTYLMEGYTLTGLRPIEGPIHTIEQIVYDFWRGYEIDEVHIEAAVRAFLQHLIPRLFPHQRGGFVGWKISEFMPNAKGGNIAIIEGSFNARYPKRVLVVQVGYQESQLTSRSLKVNEDFEIDFLLEMIDHEKPSWLEKVNKKLWRFHLNLLRRPVSTLPEDLRKLQDYVNPQLVTPLLMLALVDYFDHWEEIQERTIPESERPEVNYFTTRLLDHSLSYLLDKELAESITPPLRRVGSAMVEEVFNRICEELYPQYRTLFVSSHYERVIDDYINALKNMTLKERRGHVPIQSSKDSLAKQFGLGSVATFENRVNNEYRDLMKVVEWKGKGDTGTAIICLTLHPLENVLLEKLRQSSSKLTVNGYEVPFLPLKEAGGIGRGLGYKGDEVFIALQLLIARDYIKVDDQKGIIYLFQIRPDSGELRARLVNLREQMEQLPPGLVEKKRLARLQENLASLQTKLLAVSDSDEEELDELQTKLNDLYQEWEDILKGAGDKLRQSFNALFLEIERSRQLFLQSGPLDREIHGQVAFVQHLNEMRQKLINNRRRLSEELLQLGQHIEDTVKQAEDRSIAWIEKTYHILTEAQEQWKRLSVEGENLQEQVQHLEQWKKLLQSTDHLFESLSPLPDLQEQLTREIVPEIQSHFIRRKLEALSNWEPFQVKIQAIEEELERRRRHGNEVFGKVKEEYEKFLRDIGVKEYRPMSRYTYGEDEESYRDLYAEVHGKVRARLEELGKELEQIQLDLLKIEHIHMITSEDRLVVDQVKQQVADLERSLEALHQALSLSLIQSRGMALNNYGERLQSIAQALNEVRNKLRNIIYADLQLTEREASLLSAFGQRDEVDLTDLFVSLRQKGQKIEVKELLSILENLYRKNRVIVRIRRRR